MRKIKAMPCCVCGNKEISEYMVDDTYSYMSCDNCKINGEAKETHFQAVKAWNETMKFGKGR